MAGWGFIQAESESGQAAHSGDTLDKQWPCWIQTDRPKRSTERQKSHGAAGANEERGRREWGMWGRGLFLHLRVRPCLLLNIWPQYHWLRYLRVGQFWLVTVRPKYRGTILRYIDDAHVDIRPSGWNWLAGLGVSLSTVECTGSTQSVPLCVFHMLEKARMSFDHRAA